MVGPYVIPDGWRGVSPTATTPEEWREELKTFSWSERRLAHTFPDGWASASYKRAARAADGEGAGGAGFYIFYYADTGEYLSHNLDFVDYKVSWTIVEKDDAARPRRRARP